MLVANIPQKQLLLCVLLVLVNIKVCLVNIDMYDINKLQNLKDKIELMDKCHQIEILKLLIQSSVIYSENNSHPRRVQTFNEAAGTRPS